MIIIVNGRVGARMTQRYPYGPPGKRDRRGFQALPRWFSKLDQHASWKLHCHRGYDQNCDCKTQKTAPGLQGDPLFNPRLIQLPTISRRCVFAHTLTSVSVP